MNRFPSTKVIAVFVALAALALTTTLAFAHEGRDVGKYHFLVGWGVEPAIEGQMSGIDLTVTNVATAKPVDGLEKTLKVAVTHIPTKTSKSLALTPDDSNPGHYTVPLLLTSPGDYSFHFTGTVEGQTIDQTFTSGPNTFDTVDDATSVQFPVAVPSLRELQSATQGAVDAAQKAQDTANKASSANTLAIAGIVLGVVGIGAGVGGMILPRKKSTS